MKVDVFNGGVNSILDPSLIQTGEAQELVNVRTDSGVLEPLNGNSIIYGPGKKYLFFSDNLSKWFAADTPHDWVEYKDRVFECDRVGVPTFFENFETYPLGLTPPSGIELQRIDAPKSPFSSYDVTISDVPLSPGPGFPTPIPQGAYNYRVELYDPNTGLVSRPYTFNVDGEKEELYVTRSVSQNSRILFSIPDLAGIGSDLEFMVYRWYQEEWRAVKTPFVRSSVDLVLEDDDFTISTHNLFADNIQIAGSATYAVTYYSSVLGVESTPQIMQDDVSYGTFQLNFIPHSNENGVDEIRIYRLSGSLTKLTLIKTYVNTAGAGNITFFDDIPDDENLGVFLDNVTDGQAPEGLKYLKEAYAMLFGAVDSKLYFSKPGIPTSWPASYFIEVAAEITGISVVSIGILVHTLNKTHLLTGTGPESFAMQLLSSDQGCLNHDSIRETKDSALWVSRDGICASDGSNVRVLTRDLLGKVLLDVDTSAIVDQVYYAHLTDDTVIAFDLDRARVEYYDFGLISIVKGSQNRLAGKMGAPTEGVWAIDSDPNSVLSFLYRSPDFVGRGLTKTKSFNDLFIASTGDITVKLFIDSVEVLEKQLTSTKLTIHKVGVPSKNRVASAISYELSGTGTVRSVEWAEDSYNV